MQFAALPLQQHSSILLDLCSHLSGYVDRLGGVRRALGNQHLDLVSGGLVVVGQHLLQHLQQHQYQDILSNIHSDDPYVGFALALPDLVVELGVVQRQADVAGEHVDGVPVLGGEGEAAELVDELQHPEHPGENHDQNYGYFE